MGANLSFQWLSFTKTPADKSGRATATAKCVYSDHVHIGKCSITINSFTGFYWGDRLH